MNVTHVSNDLRPIVEEISRRFQGRIESLYAPRLNEIYFQAPMELAPGFCAQLYKKWNARLVSLFADDARAQAGAFHLYYVFALDAAHGFDKLTFAAESPGEQRDGRLVQPLVVALDYPYAAPIDAVLRVDGAVELADAVIAPSDHGPHGAERF